jgi:excisionase family DNA binding protein
VSEPLALAIPAELVEGIARRVVELLGVVEGREQELGSPWLDVEGACTYLGVSKNVLYRHTASGSIPCRKKLGGQGLRFHVAELDAWMQERYPRVDRLA